MIHKIQNFIARGLHKLKKKTYIEKCDLLEIHIFSNSIKCMKILPTYRTHLIFQIKYNFISQEFFHSTESQDTTNYIKRKFSTQTIYRNCTLMSSQELVHILEKTFNVHSLLIS